MEAEQTRKLVNRAVRAEVPVAMRQQRLAGNAVAPEKVVAIHATLATVLDTSMTEIRYVVLAALVTAVGMARVRHAAEAETPKNRTRANGVAALASTRTPVKLAQIAVVLAKTGVVKTAVVPG